MKYYFIIVTLMFFTFQTVDSLAVERKPETLQDLIALSLKVNLGLQIERVEAEKRVEDITIAQSVFDSSLFASTSYERTSTPYVSTVTSYSSSQSKLLSGQIGVSRFFSTGLTAALSLNSAWTTDNDYTNGLDPSYRSSLILDLTQPLLRNRGTVINTTALKVSQNQHYQSSLNYLLEAQSLVLEIETVARELATKNHIILLRHEALELAVNLLKANKKRFSAGFIPVTEVQEAETAHAARQLDLSLAIQDRDLTREELNRKLNYSLSDKFDLIDLAHFNDISDSDNIPTLEQLIKSAHQHRLELKINDYSVQNSSLQQTFLKNQLKPQFDLNVQVGVNGLSGSESSSALSHRYSGNWPDSFSSMSDADGYQWRAGIEFRFPINNRSAKSRYQQAKLQLKQDNFRHNDLKKMIEKDVKQQHVNIYHSKNQLDITKRFESLAQQSFHQEQQRLEEGLSDTFRIILFQQKMIEAKIDRINAMSRYQLAYAQLEFATGQIFERHQIIFENHPEELSLENI